MVGYVSGPHGVYGELKVNTQGISDFPEKRIVKGSGLFLQVPGRRAPRPFVCTSGRPGSKPFSRIVRLKGVQDRDNAVSLRGVCESQ